MELVFLPRILVIQLQRLLFQEISYAKQDFLAAHFLITIVIILPQTAVRQMSKILTQIAEDVAMLVLLRHRLVAMEFAKIPK